MICKYKVTEDEIEDQEKTIQDTASDFIKMENKVHIFELKKKIQGN